MGRQLEAFAYGDITNGGIVIGGENSTDTYSLIGWDLDDASFTRKTFSVDFWVHGRGTTEALRRVDFEANLLALDQAATRGSGNLGITAGTERTMTVDVTVVGQTVTITQTAGDNFVVAEDVGIPVSIEGLGAYQLATVSSTTVATAEVPAALATPTPTVGATARIGYNHFQIEDGAANRGGFFGRASLNASPSDEDEKFRRKYALRIVFERPGDDVRDGTTGNRRRAKYSVSLDSSELLNIAFSGEFTSGGGADAVTNYNAVAGVTAWITAILATFTGKTFDKVGADLYDTDDENGVLTFQAQRKQINFPEGAAGLDDDSIRSAEVSFTRTATNIHGLKGQRQPFQVTATYDAAINVDETTYDQIYSLWGNQIKPHLVERILSIFGSAVVIMSETAPAIDVVNNRVSASFVALISKSGSSNVYSYRRSNSYELTENAEIDQIYDGRVNSAVVWFPGHLVFGSVNIEVATIGKASGGANTGQQTGKITGLPGIGIFGIGKRLRISFGGGKQEGADSKLVLFPAPADPKTVLGDVGTGAWIALGRSARISPVVWGKDPDNAGATVEVKFASYSQRFVWLAEAGKSAEDDVSTPNRVPSGGGGGVGASQIKQVKKSKSNQ